VDAGCFQFVWVVTDLVSKRFADESFFRGWLGGGCCVVVGDSSWRSPLFFGSISVVAYSCLCLR